MDIVLLTKSIKFLGIDLFPKAIEEVNGPVQVEVVPRPAKCRDSLPFVPSIAGHAPEKAAVPPLSGGSPRHYSCFHSGHFEAGRTQLRRPGSRSKWYKTPREVA